MADAAPKTRPARPVWETLVYTAKAPMAAASSHMAPGESPRRARRYPMSRNAIATSSSTAGTA